MMLNKTIIIVTWVIASESEATQALLPLFKDTNNNKQESIPGFTKQYNCKQLVYYEQVSCMLNAIAREKQIKAGSRKNKLALIESMNPTWLDLYETLL
jgi:predicted GIY-YIG superfamily endonuclease